MTPAGVQQGEDSPPLLRLEGLAVQAGGVPLLRGIDLSLFPGELVALTGPSGCGKTTLLRAICGLNNPLEGRVLLQGKTAENWGWPAFRRQVLLVEQRPLVLEATVEENLKRPFGYRSAVAAGQTFSREAAKRLLERVGLGGGERLSQKARSLSVGQQQRLCLVRALLLEPLVLLLDEPTSALDTDAATVVELLIREYATERGMAALLVTHDTRQADTWCDRRFPVCAHAVAAPPATDPPATAGAR